MARHRQPILCLAGIFLWAATAAAGIDLISIAPDLFSPGESALPAQAGPGGGVQLLLPFDSPAERVYWDIPIRRLDPATTAIAVELSSDDPAAIRSLTLHLQNGTGWLSAGAVLEGPGRQTLFFHRADFASEGGRPSWQHSATLRLSAWKGAPRAATLTIYSIRTETFSVGILRGTESTAPGESALAATCANRAQRLFEIAGVPATILSDDLAALDLKPYRILVLPYNPSLSDRQIDLLERFVARRNGRLGVFFQTNSRLAKLLGFALEPYATQAETWNTVAFASNAIPGLPASLAHLTQHLLPVRADAPSSTTLGHWLNPDGSPDIALPAAAVSPRGLWFSHIPPLAEPSAVQWLLASLAAADPVQLPALEQHLADSASRDAQSAGLLATVPAPQNEIRAAWSLPLSAHLCEKTMSTLASSGINVLFAQLATAGFVHEPSEAPGLESDPDPRRAPKFIARALAVAHARHIQLHAWVVCWNLDRLPDTRIAPLRAENRLMQDAQGNEILWLCPSRPENRTFLLDAFSELARLGLDGIHLDYIRYPARNGCYCPATRAAFETSCGRPVSDWPADVLPGASRAAEFDDFRRSEMTAFVAEAAEALRTINPALRLSAAVYPTPEAAAENGQDWPAWLRADTLDFVAPMLYTPDATRFAAWLELALAAAPDAAHILPGIGTGSDASQLDALAAAQQILAARQRRTAGFAFFQLDSDLTTRLLPPLSLP